MAKGVIFSIEEFAVNDGPGIRTTVFLKGCPLRCEWCHNPEGFTPYPQVMHLREGDVICGREMDSSELCDNLLKNEEFFRLNEGGVTFTGGEPTFQADFLCDVMDGLSSVHKAVETSGYCSSVVWERVLARVDYVLYDVKIVDPVLHKRYTGVDNKPILENLKMLKNSGKPFVVRVPLIPGVNDNKENMDALGDLLVGAPDLQRVEFLRYHRTAGAKYPMVDMVYSPSFDQNGEINIFGLKENISTILL